MDKIMERLQDLETYTEIISVAATFEKSIFLHDPLVCGGAGWYIQLALKCIADINNKICREYGFTGIDYPETLELLQRHKVYPDWLVKNLAGKREFVPGQDNEVIEGIEKEKLYELLTETLSDFRYIKKFVLEYIFQPGKVKCCQTIKMNRY